MTDKLKTLMDRATDVDFAAVDLDAITATGDRTVRRRRVTAGVAGVAAVAVIAAGAVLLGEDDGDKRTDLVDNPFPTSVPTWTEGRILHTPDATYDLGADVVSYVRTSEGIVFIGGAPDDELEIGVYSFAGDEPVQIGSTTETRLLSDPERPYAGFVNADSGGREFAVYDQSADRIVWTRPGLGKDEFPYLAIDGGDLYIESDKRGPMEVVDVASGDARTLPEGPDQAVGVDGERLVYRTSSDALVVGSGGDEGVLLDGATDGPALFSADGRWVTARGSGDDLARVYDTGTGAPIHLDLDLYDFAYAYEWLDDGSVMLIGNRGDTVPELLECQVPEGDCSVVTELDGIKNGDLFAVALGEFVGFLAVQSSDSDTAVETAEVEPR